MSLYPALDELLELRYQARSLGLTSHHLVNSALAGLYASVFRGQGLDFDEVREYREGDDIRNMDWKITARTGEPHLKVFREERERTVMLCVDRGMAMEFGTRGTFKSVQAARAAALLGWSATQHHDRVGGLIFGRGDQQGLMHFRPARGRRVLWRMLRSLTEPAPEAPADDSQGMRLAIRRLARGLPTGTLVFLIGSFAGDPLELRGDLLGLGRHQQLVLVPVDDPADWELPDLGTMVFTDSRGEQVEVNTGSAEGRQRYSEDWQSRRAALRRAMDGLAIPMIPLRTDRDVHRDLIVGLRAFARRRNFR